MTRERAPQLRTPLKPSLSISEDIEYLEKGWSPMVPPPALHTAEEGDYQRWFPETERGFEEKGMKDMCEKLKTRQPKEVEEVLETLCEYCEDVEPRETPEGQGSSSLRDAVSRFVPGFWESPFVDSEDGGEESEKQDPILNLLVRTRVILSDLAIGVLLTTKEKLGAHCIFWRWVEIHPKIYASAGYAKRLIKMFYKIEKALDAAAGVVHVSAANIVKDCEKRNIYEVSKVVEKLLLELSNGAAAMFSDVSSIDRTTSILSEETISAAYAVGGAVEKHHPGPLTGNDATLVKQLLKELNTLQRFPRDLLSTIDELYTPYYRFRSMAVAASCVTIFTLTAYLYTTKKYEQFVQYWQSTKTAWGEFLTYHVVEPAKGIYHELMLPVPELVAREDAIEAVTEGNLSLQRMLADFIKTAKPECTEALELVKEGRIHAVEAWVPVMQVLEEQIKYPLFNAARGEVGRALLLEAIKTKVTIDQQTVEVDLLLRANRLNMNIFSTIPAFALIYCGARLYESIKSRFSRRLPTNDPSIKCVLCLREIHRLFSHITDSNIPASLETEADYAGYYSWLEEHGRILSALSMLERSAASMGNLRIEIKTALAEDLELLKTMYAEDCIKITEVDRIWRTYPWILSSRI